MKISENVPIKNLTTMRLGGPAKYVIEIEKYEDIEPAFNFASEKNLPVYILGAGANTIGRDEGFAGVIIINHIRGISEIQNPGGWPSLGDPQPSLSEDGGKCEDRTRPELSHFITAMGGELWDNVVKFTTDRGYTGIEALSKIPGLAGAAPVQNIGAYGQELLDTFDSAEVYDIKTKSFKTLEKSDLKFDYRRSILNSTEKGRYFVISITLKLREGQMSRPFYASMEKYIEEHGCTDFTPAGIREIVSTIRKNKLPDPATDPSAGSFFKNIYLSPAEVKDAEKKNIPIFYTHDLPNIYSGWLIEQCGLKGKLLHGIRVSDKASLILINESATGYDDLAKARTEIIDAVQQKYGYTLEQEPNEI